MTGFGTAEGALAGGRVLVEMKTVNHRHFSLQCRMPAEFQRFESEMRNRLRERFERGHISLTLRWSETPERGGGVAVDVDRAIAVRNALERLREALGVPGEIDLGFIARQPDVLSFGQDEERDVDVGELQALVDMAALEVLESRDREGAALAADLTARLTTMEARLAAIEQWAPERLTAERDRLRQAVAELLDGRPLDDTRLAQELAITADRLDITEEIVRLRSHFAAFREALAGDAAVGRRLSFLGQEMLREVNTIGSKANHAAIAEAVIDLKTELEKVREQVENIE